MPKLDPASIVRRVGSSYPAPFDQPCATRTRRALGDAGGLTDFGANLLELPAGAWSSQRHWHSAEDEFVWVLSGEVILIEDGGETVLRSGNCAAFPRGAANGHHLVNRSDSVALCLEVGTRREDDVCVYSDIDMRIDSRIGWFAHKDGKPYPKQPRG